MLNFKKNLFNVKKIIAKVDRFATFAIAFTIIYKYDKNQGKL